MSRHIPRAATVIAGVATLSILLAATLMLAPKLERRWHLWRLENNPALLESFLLSERIPVASAVEIFLQQAKGKQALFELYLREVDATEPTLDIVKKIARSGADPDEGGRLALVADGIQQQNWRLRQGWGSFSMAISPTDARRRQRVLALLTACSARFFRLPSVPNVEFYVAAVVEGKAQLPPWLENTPAAEVSSELVVVVNGARHVCYYRARPDAAGRSP